MPTWWFFALFLQVSILNSDLEARKEAHTQLEEENKNKEEINNNFEMAINELNKEILVSICFDCKGQNCACQTFPNVTLFYFKDFPCNPFWGLSAAVGSVCLAVSGAKWSLYEVIVQLE